MDAFVCFTARGKYYIVHEVSHGAPPNLGREILNEIPVGSDEFNGNVPANTPFASLLIF